MAMSRSAIYDKIVLTVELQIQEWTSERARISQQITEWQERQAVAQARVTALDEMLHEAQTELSRAKTAQASQKVTDASPSRSG